MTKMSAKLFSHLHTTNSLFRRRRPIADFTHNKNFRRNSTIESKDYFQVNEAISWDPQGPLRPLYLLNYIRVPYYRDSLVHVVPGEKFSTCLKGKKILDVGCGGGYISEALAKLGAEVIGIDSSQEAIDYAKRNSKMRLTNNLPNYMLSTIEEHCKENAESYDVVIVAEVIDHVAQKELFVESCARAAKPGAKLFFSTINRTRFAQLYFINLFEDVLKIVPKGAHKYDMLIRPSELKYMLEMNDCFVKSKRGYFYFPFARYWRWIKSDKYLFSIEAVKC